MPLTILNMQWRELNDVQVQTVVVAATAIAALPAQVAAIEACGAWGGKWGSQCHRASHCWSSSGSSSSTWTQQTQLPTWKQQLMEKLLLCSSCSWSCHKSFKWGSSGSGFCCHHWLVCPRIQQQQMPWLKCSEKSKEEATVNNVQNWSVLSLLAQTEEELGWNHVFNFLLGSDEVISN